MPAVKTGMTPPPMPGMPAPMQPMGGVPPMQNPFAPMPPMPLAGMPPPSVPPMQQGQPMPQGQQGQMMGSTAGRRRRFGDALEGMLGRNQGIGAVSQQQRRPLPMPQMMPQQRMVAPNTPMMRTPTPRPMAMGGEVDIFGYDDGGLVIRTLSDGNAYIDFGGGAMHHVSPNQMGDDVVQSLKDAYGDRIGGVTAATAEQEADILARVAAMRGNTGTSTSSTSSSSNSGSSSTADTSNTATSTGDVYAGSGLSGDVSSGGMSGNIGSSADSYEMASLYGPNINIPEKVSQYVQNPVTGQITTTAGPVMTAISPIGAINLPARPVELDVFDYLGDPTYGSLLDKQVEGMRDGGAVPRQTMSGLSLGPAPDGLGVYLDGDRLSDPADMHQKMLRAGYSRDAIMDSAAHIADDLMDYAGGARSGFGHSHGGYEDGGQVLPRRTDIMGQDHFLAYIRPDEADILEDLGGAGEPGPGGIPSYFFHNQESRDRIKDFFSGGGGSSSSSSNTSSSSNNESSNNVSSVATTSSGATIIPTGATIATGTVLNSASDPVINVNGTLYNQSNLPAGVSGDNVTARVSGRSSSGGRNLDADLGVGMSSNTVTADQLSSGAGTTTYDTGDGGSVTVATGSSIDDVLSTASSGGGGGGGSSVMDVIAPSSVYTPPAPTYTDRFGREYGTQREADIANQMYANQLASYSAGKVGFDRFKAGAAETFPGRSREETDRMAARAYPDFVEDYSRDINIFDADVPQPFSYTDIGGIGAGPAGGSLGITPAPVIDPDAQTGKEGPNFVKNLTNFYDNKFDEDGQPVISLGEIGLRQPAGTPTSMYDFDPGEDYTPSSADLARQLRDAGLTDQRVSSGFDTGLMRTGTGDTYLQNVIDKADEDGNVTVFVQGMRTKVDVNDPDQVAALAASIDRGNTLDYYDEKTGLFNDLQAEAALERAGRPIVSPDRDDPRGDQIVSPTGTGTGLQSDLQRGLGATGPIAARDADMDPFGTGTQVSLQDVKDRVARAEGTADEGGYGRLLGNQEGRFGVDLTDMTVQEVLDFQKARGPGSYAEYSQGVNEQRGMTRADGSGVISTPAGKYQVVGATLEDLIDKGVVDPNAKFDEGTQEKIGSYLIAERRGLNDLQAGNITREQFEENLGKEFEGIERGLDKGAGATSAVIAAASETGRQAEVDRRDENVEKIKKQIGDQADPTGGEKLFYDFVGALGFGLGKGLADKLRGASKENRQAIIDQHLYALENGATPKTDKEGNYIGFDISTMDTFADKVLGAEDIMAFMPPSHGTYKNPAYQADADGDGVIDSERFAQVYDAQSTAAAEDPYGYSTEQGFITEDGREFFVDATGKVVEVTDGVVPFNVGGGDDTTDIFSTTTMTDDDDDDDDTTTTTTDDTDTGHKDGVCNNPDYVYNPETDKCEPKAEETDDGDLGSPITTAITPRSFDEVLRSVVVPAPDIAPISANIRPMQGGGMAGLNRAADNFLKALAG